MSCRIVDCLVMDSRLCGRLRLIGDSGKGAIMPSMMSLMTEVNANWSGP